MSKVRIYKVPTALEEAARYARAAGMTLAAWQELDEKKRNSLKEKIDAIAKLADRRARAAARERHYASTAGMTLSAWRGLTAADRKAKKCGIDACEKAERESKRQRAANEKLKSDAKKPLHKKHRKEPASEGLPGTTRYSTIVGLVESPSNKKWNLFLKDGPYWNYLKNYLNWKGIFAKSRARAELIEEVINNTFADLAKFFAAKKYVYPRVGEGCFRNFIKIAAINHAITELKKVNKYEIVAQEKRPKKSLSLKENEELVAEQRMSTAMVKANASRHDCAGGTLSGAGQECEFDQSDKGAGLVSFAENHIEEQTASKLRSIEELRENSDDEGPTTYDPAAFFEFQDAESLKRQKWIQQLLTHVFYIALGHVLGDGRVSADWRELLRVRYVLEVARPKDIYKMPQFAHLPTMGAFEQKMKNANDRLKKEVMSWWKFVAPSRTDFSNEVVLKLWRNLLEDDKTAKMTSRLRRLAKKRVGDVA